MTKGKKDTGRWSRGGGPDKHPPQRVVTKALLLALLQLLILLFSAVAVTTPTSVLVLAQEAQTIASAGSPQHPCCGCPRPLEALFGEAAALGGRRLAIVTFSPSTLGAAPALAIGILYARAQCCHEQQPGPQGEKLPLASHYPGKKDSAASFHEAKPKKTTLVCFT